MQLNATPQFQSLTAHADSMRAQHLADLLTKSPDRFDAFHVKNGALLIDISRQRITEETLTLLLGSLQAQGFAEKRAALFSGAVVNPTEGRAALHMALRANADEKYQVGGKDVMADVVRERDRALAFAEAVRSGGFKLDGNAIKHVIHVGIGGSDLGPRLLVHAFADKAAPAMHFLGNVDAVELEAVMRACEPAATLVILASKTFTTSETMQNAKALQAWLAKSVGADKALSHMVALTAAPDVARAFGIDDARIFRFWDWVGGRVSITSVIGLPAMIAMGADAFRDFLAGARAMDQHFRDAPLRHNMPVLMAAMDVWNGNFMGAATRAVLPYAEKLGEWVFYLQQLEMESLGKQTDLDGKSISYSTCGVVFGATGTPAQHAFMQALHQGHAAIPADIVMVRKTDTAHPGHQALLLANALAQAEALAGGTHNQMGGNAVAQHKYFPGNRPSTLIILDRLTPHAFGELIALYEHKVFAASVFWHINPFDQWGVELGKRLAAPLCEALAGGTDLGTPHLQKLVAYLKEN